MENVRALLLGFVFGLTLCLMPHSLRVDKTLLDFLSGRFKPEGYKSNTRAVALATVLRSGKLP